MWIVIAILIIVVFAAGIVYLSTTTSPKREPRKHYLGQIAGLFEGALEPLPGSENSFEIRFSYQGQEFRYQDVEIAEFRQVAHRGYLKMKTPSNLTLRFTERPPATIRVEPKSIEDVGTSMWGKSVEQVRLPKALQEFSVYTNNFFNANKLLADDKITKTIVGYKNRDSRGHPLMSMEISDGEVILEFHPTEDLRPSVLDLHHNPTSIEGYLKELSLLAGALKSLGRQETD